MTSTTHKVLTGENEHPFIFPLPFQLSDFASESVIVSDAHGVIQYWNAASEALYGWPAMAMIGQSYEAFCEHDAEHIRTLLQEGRWEGVVHRRNQAGTKVAAAVRQIARRDANGTVLDIVEFGRNAGEISQAATMRLDAELQGSLAPCWELDTSSARLLLDTITELRSRGISVDLEQHPEWVEELLTATRISAVNDRAVRMFGAHAGQEQMIGQRVGAFWPAESRSVLATLIESVASDRSRLETRKMVLSGAARDAIIRAWHAAEPKPLGSVFVTINGAPNDDRSSWELQASEERYRKLIQYLPTALWQVDSRRADEVFDQLKANGVRDIGAYLDENPDLVEHAKDVVHVTEVNRDAISLFRASNASDLIKPVRYIFAAAPGLANRVMVAHFERRRNFIEQTKILAFDGTIIDVLFTVTYPVPPEQLDTTFITMQDISERLNAERQVRKLQADFTHAGRIATLGELATSIAHEINQPLTAILTNAETSLRWLARADQNIEKVTQLTSRVVSNARRAGEIIQRIRGMAVKQEPEKRLIDLNEVVQEALLFSRHDMESKSIALSTTFGSGLPRVMGDRIQLQQVMINLLVNSVQAIAQSGQPTRRIDIETSIDDDGSVVFSIFDNGPGIAATDLEHIFDRFFSTKDSGIGIGLAICQSIIAAHGGSISGSNRSNGGAHFRFTLPVSMGPGATSDAANIIQQTHPPLQ
ncbi:MULTISPECIES: ATP-binding protein [unclassified Bradyrhizobium]|uniref:PAS domain-containing sensor histidine kinase n=1 Tax=unclassified Bradyrhizobium TaxID=2631580 RepID=UPI00247928A7|nr:MULTISPECIES: ATP-binding protein [unclassified Bradyrhizobium]WGS19873.1 ATP-binding protein [Bradyrhizobium sp. ISRA463]WGS26726.1 ATP-binding protein [Bradyrhizobium sp. ISRA464]